VRTVALDVGNTRIKSGLFEDAELVEVRQWDAARLQDFVAYATNRKAEKLIFSSVGTDIARDLAAGWPKPEACLELKAETPLPFTNTYQTPQTLGKDRVAAVAGARGLFPDRNVLVVDAGTCITFDLLTADGRYLGGNISPGLDMRYRAMHDYTARLPWVDRAPREDMWGRTTEEALQNGGLFGLVAELAFYTRAVEEQFGNAVTLLTGGDAQLLALKWKSQIFVRPHLVLLGLNQILRFNEEELA